jgi:hypothetical protein
MMKKTIALIALLIFAVSVGSQVRRNAIAHIPFFAVDTTGSAFKPWTGNDSNKMNGYVYQDSTVARLHGTFATTRDTAGTIRGYRYRASAADLNCKLCTFYFYDTGGIMIPPVYIATQTVEDTQVSIQTALSKLPDTTLFTRNRISKADSIDAKITTRLATTGYTAPNNTVSAAQAGRLDSLLHMPSSLYYGPQLFDTINQIRTRADSLDAKITSRSSPSVAQTITAPSVIDSVRAVKQVTKVDTVRAVARVDTVLHPRTVIDTVRAVGHVALTDSTSKIPAVTVGAIDSVRVVGKAWFVDSLRNLKASMIDNTISSRQPKTVGAK